MPNMEDIGSRGDWVRYDSPLLRRLRDSLGPERSEDDLVYSSGDPVRVGDRVRVLFDEPRTHMGVETVVQDITDSRTRVRLDCCLICRFSPGQLEFLERGGEMSNAYIESRSEKLKNMVVRVKKSKKKQYLVRYTVARDKRGIKITFKVSVELERCFADAVRTKRSEREGWPEEYYSLPARELPDAVRDYGGELQGRHGGINVSWLRAKGASKKTLKVSCPQVVTVKKIEEINGDIAAAIRELWNDYLMPVQIATTIYKGGEV